MDSAQLVEPLSKHPQLSALASLVRSCALEAAQTRRADFGSRSQATISTAGRLPEGLNHADAETTFGNVITVLERGALLPEERALLGALLALSFSLQDEPEPPVLAEVWPALVWLAAHTPCNALQAIDRAVGERSEAVWRSIAEFLDAPERAPMEFGRTELLVAASALRAAQHPVGRQLRFELSERTPDPEIYALLVPGPEEFQEELVGEVQPPPRGWFLTTVLAVSLLLFVMGLVRLIARVAFGYKRPATLRIGPQGLELANRIELMGRVLRDRATLLPLSHVMRVTREVKYARAGLYVGIAALTIGTYLGTGLLVDGLRVPGGSAPLLGLAAVFIIVGLAVDFVLSSAADTLRGRCRVVILPERGRTLCIGGLDAARADALLSALAEKIQRRPEPTPEGARESAVPPVARPENSEA